MYFFHGTFNMLMCFNLKTDELQYIASVEDEKMYQRMLYSKIFYYDNKLYLIPWTARKIAIYDLKENKFEYFVLEKENESEKFQEAWQIGEYIYCFPIDIQDSIIKFSTVSNTIVKTIEVNGYVNDVCEISPKLIGGVIWPSNQYFILNTEEDTIQIIECGNKDETYSTIISDGQYVYLHNYKTTMLYKVEIFTGKILEAFILEVFNIENEECRLIGIKGNEIYIDLLEEPMQYILNIQDKTLKKMWEQEARGEERFYNYWYMNGVYHSCDAGKEEFYFNRYNNFLYIKNGKGFIKKKLELKEKDMERALDRIVVDGVWEENNLVDMKRFIRGIARRESYTKIEENRLVGKEIFQFVKES